MEKYNTSPSLLLSSLFDSVVFDETNAKKKYVSLIEALIVFRPKPGRIPKSTVLKGT